MSTPEEALTLCAEITYTAHRSMAATRGEDLVLWHNLSDAARYRWMRWIDKVIAGQAEPEQGQHFAALIARTTAEHLGITRSEGPIGRVVTAVSAHYGVSVAELMGRGRQSELALPRHVAMFMAVEVGFAKSAVGRFFDRDHGTVISALRKVQALLLAGDKPTTRAVETLRAIFAAEVPDAA